MSYQPGKMGLAEGLALVFIPTFASVFLSLGPINLDMAATAAWMTPFVHFVPSVAVLYALLYVLKNTTGDFYAACQELLSTTITRLVILYYIGVFFLDAGLLIRQFAEDTLLTALPQVDFELITVLYVFMVVFLIYLGIEALARTTYIVIPFIGFGIILVVGLLFPQYHWLYLAPWNGRGLDKVLLAGIKVSGVDLAIIIPVILAGSFQNRRTIKGAVLYGLGLSASLKALTIAAGIAAFGVPAGQETVLPFYQMARLIYINRFVQHLEALSIILWSIVGMLTIALEIYVGLYLLGRLFNLPTFRPLIIPVVLILAELSMLPDDLVSVITFYAWAEYSIYSAGWALIPAVLFLAASYRVWRRRAC